MRALVRAVAGAVALCLAGCYFYSPGELNDMGPSAARTATKRWEVLLAPDAPRAVELTALDVVKFAGEMGREATLVRRAGAVSCRNDRTQVVFAGDGLGDPGLPADAGPQTVRIAETLCGTGRLVVVAGGGTAGRQYAGYAYLHEIGVRFFHPEQTYVPEAPALRTTPIAYTKTPDFAWRGVSLHLTHPLEIGDAVRLNKAEHMGEVTNYIDWEVRNFANFGLYGASPPGNTPNWGYDVDSNGPLSDYGLMRGIARSTSFSLRGSQQGAQPVINPDDPRPVKAQIRDAIDARMGADPAAYPQIFTFTFDPTEFTETDDRQTVEELTFIADYFAQNYPDTLLLTNNHGSFGEPTPNYGVRFYDLSQFAPPNLGVRVHPLMFFDVFRPAPIYGNQNFNFLYDFMAREYTKRPLWYFPEAAWWLTWDIAVPLYLPITLQARQFDFDGMSYMLAGGLSGHYTFGSGHEWGYWQNEYCPLRMSFDITYRYEHCIRDIASPAGPAAADVEAALFRAIDIQERDLIYGDLIAWVAGTDPETETAESVGVSFHPLPPSPKRIELWTAAQVDEWLSRIDPPLKRMEADFQTLVDRLNAVRDKVPARGLPWFDEVRDGLEINAVRARHGHQVYGAVVRHRKSKLTNDEALAAEAKALLDAAEATTARARAVVERREAGYRYKPLARAVAGGPAGTEDENWTVYRYRVLNRAHHVYYYARIDALARQAVEDAGEPVYLADALIGPGESLVLEVRDAAIEDPVTTTGDGGRFTERTVRRAYAAPGAYDVRLDGRRSGAPYSYTARVAALTEKNRTGFTARIVEPPGASIISGVLPGIVYGRIADARPVIGFTASETNRVLAEQWVEAQPAAPGGEPAVFAAGPQDLRVPVVNRAQGVVSTTLTVKGATVRRATADAPLVVRGSLRTADVIQAAVLVSGGAIPERNARNLVAQRLGYTVDTLPVEVPFVIEFGAATAGR